MSATFDPQALKQQFNPEGSLLRRQQLRLTELLMAVDRICRKHDIPYWLSSGTLLGAVRHCGFIPWDDDLDIELLRPDYERLMKVLPAELPDTMTLQTNETDPNYIFAFAKVRDKRSWLLETNHYDRIFTQRGIFLDIFPFEKSPRLLHWISCRAHGFIYNVLNNKTYDDETAARKARRIYTFNRRFTFPLLRTLCKLWATDKVRYGLGVPYNDTRRLSDIFPLTEIEFEGYSVPAPGRTHNYLQRKYGDYMQLPDLTHISYHAEQLRIDD